MDTTLNALLSVVNRQQNPYEILQLSKPLLPPTSYIGNYTHTFYVEHLLEYLTSHIFWLVTAVVHSELGHTPPKYSV